jgi:DNA-binding transcriptional MerR regulator
MPTDAPYSISDLAGLTGLSVRTIRYYLAQGLIPASGESGPGAHYGDGHLGRLRLVRRLQQQHLPLAEIRSRLASLTDAEVIGLTDAETVAQPATSALEYVRSVLAPRGDMATSMPPAPGAPNRFLRRMAAPFAAQVRTVMAEPALPLATAQLPASIAPGPEAPGASAAQPAEVAAPQPAAISTPQPAPASMERSQWERLSLGPDLELHIRRPLGRLEQKRVERLITIARQVLKEEQP